MEIEIIDFVRRSKLEYEKTSREYKDYKKRFIYPRIKGRLNILYGLRGTGKTTLLFQKYLETKDKKRIYLHGAEIRLLKLSLVEIIRKIEYLFGEETSVFIDEINNLKEWDAELKIAYDKYPKMRFCITGSSSLNLLSSKKLLARRANYIHVPPLNFREYLYIKHNILLERFKPNKEDFLRSAMRYDIYIKEKLGGMNLMQIVDKYIETNLPYLLEGEKNTLIDLVEKAIFFDIIKEKNIESNTLSKFERLILLLSASTTTSYEILSKDLGVSKSVISEMLLFLEKADIVKRIYPYKKGKTIGRKEWKYYFTVPMIRKLYAGKMVVPDSDTAGNMNEDIFAANFEDVFFGKIDFVWGDFLVEIASSKKGFEQFKGIKTKKTKLIVYKGENLSEKDETYKIPFYVFYSIL